MIYLHILFNMACPYFYTGISGLVGITDMTALQQATESVNNPDSGSQEYTYDEGSNSAAQIPTVSHAATSQETPNEPTSHQKDEHATQGPALSAQKTNPGIKVVTTVPDEEHTTCTKFQTVLEQQTGILQGLLFLFKTKMKQVDTDEEKKEKEPPPNFQKYIEEQHEIISQQTKMLKKQEELLTFHRQCFDRMGAILQKVCQTHDMTADSKYAKSNFLHIYTTKE